MAFGEVKWRDVSLPQWASYQIHKIAGCVCAGNAGKYFPATHFDYLTFPPCITAHAWRTSGSPTRGGGETLPGISEACVTHNFAYLERGLLDEQECVNQYKYVILSE